MSKAKVRDPDVADEYDFSKAQRGVYHERAKKGMTFSIVTDQEDQLRNRPKRRPSNDRPKAL